MAPALRMTRSIKEKLKIFWSRVRLPVPSLGFLFDFEEHFIVEYISYNSSQFEAKTAFIYDLEPGLLCGKSLLVQRFEHHRVHCTMGLRFRL